MIDFSVEAKGKCKNCPYMDLDVEANNVYAYGKLADRAISVKCEHESLCYHLEQYLKDFKDQEEKDAQEQHVKTTEENDNDSETITCQQEWYCGNCIYFHLGCICEGCYKGSMFTERG